MLRLNLEAAWIAIFIGFVGGAVQGLFFHREDWFGGYASWRRRLMRLGHISFFGLAFINFAFVFTVNYLRLPERAAPSILFVVALFTMPLICYLSAWKNSMRHAFFIPVGSLLAASILLLVDIL